MTVKTSGVDSQRQVSEVDPTAPPNQPPETERVEFERLIADIVTNLAKSGPDTADDAIDHTLKSLGRFLRAERAFLARISNDRKTFKNANLWSAEGIEVTSSLSEVDIAADLPWLARQILNGEVINTGPELNRLTGEAKQLRGWLQRHGINSGVVVPIRVEEESIGLLGLDTIVRPQNYPPAIVERLKIIADMIGSTLQRIRTQRKLEQYRHIVESTTSIVGLVDKNYVYQYVNDGYCAAFQKDRQEIIGSSVADLFGQEMFDKTLKPHYDRCFEGEKVTFQSWTDLPGWGHRFMDVHYAPYLGTDHKVAAAVVSVHDITGTKLLELQLAESEERFRAFMDNTPDSVYIKDENDRHIYGNPAAIESVNRKPDEFIGSTTRDFFPHAVADKLIELDRQVREGETPRIVEEWQNTVAGDIRWRRDIKFPIRLQSGKRLLGGIAIDITEMKQAEVTVKDLMAFDQLLTRLSVSFIDVPNEKVDRVIEDALEKIGRIFKLDRCSFGRLTPDKKEMQVTHVWNRKEIAATRMSYPLDRYRWLLLPFVTGKPLIWSRSEGLPAGTQDDIRLLEESGMQSFAGIPVTVAGQPTSCLGFSATTQERVWDSQITERFPVIAAMFGHLTARKQAEDMLEKASAELEERLVFELAIADIAAKMAQVQPEDLNAVIDETLQLIGRLLHTERVFLAQFSADGERLDFTNVWAAEEFSPRSKIFNMNLVSDIPWVAKTIRNGKIFKAGPGLTGLPDEARELRIQLERDGISSGCVVPVIVADRSIGMLGVDTMDQPREYPAPLVDRLRFVANIIGSTLQRIGSQKLLIEQLQFEDLISDLSATFINIKASEIDKIIERGLQLVVKHLDLDRGNLFEFSRGNKELTLTHSSASEGMKHSPRVLYSSQHPWFTQMLLNGEMFFFSQPSELPNEAQSEKKYLREHGIQSAMVYPLEAAGIIRGGITLSSIRRRRQWPEHLMQQCKILVQVFSNALLRKHADNKIRETLAEIRELNARIEKENIYLREEIDLRHQHDEIIGKSQQVLEMLARTEQVAETDSTVLILGETGTGKELLADEIHRLSRRKGRAMIKVNCAALPVTLIESELFGREKGAYTGAMSRQIGRFEIADGSTLFLDEIGEMPLELQAKLLRVLQEGQFERLGSPNVVNVDVRIIASTNRDLTIAVQEGKFREDLFYRLNVFSITVPPLRDRLEDIPMLVWAFVKGYESTMGKTIHTIPKKTIKALQQYAWPGNIRQLKNVVENAMIVAKGKSLQIIPPVDFAAAAHSAIRLEDVERNHIQDVLKKTSWRVSGKNGAAELLGMKPTTLASRMKKLGIARPS